MNTVSDDAAREDCRKISALMRQATGSEPKMWGANIIGFGKRNLKYDSGRELEWMQIGFSPRKQNITLYLNLCEGWNEDLLSKLGKHKTGKGCLYFRRLSDVDESVLRELIEETVKK